MIIGFIMILLAIMVIALLHLFITKNSCTRIIIMTSVCHRVVEVVIVGVVAAAVAVAVTAAFLTIALTMTTMTLTLMLMVMRLAVMRDIQASW